MGPFLLYISDFPFNNYIGTLYPRGKSMATINIQGTIIEFPDSGESPNWAPAMIQFAQAVELAISSFAGTYDVPPQIQIIGSTEIVSNVDIAGLSFPASIVINSIIYYSVQRSSSTTSLVETGELAVNYNGTSWELQRLSTSGGTVGDAKITFNITATGQVQFSTEAIGGINHSGIISFRAISNTNL